MVVIGERHNLGRFTIACIAQRISRAPATHTNPPVRLSADVANHFAVFGDMASEKPSPSRLCVPTRQVSMCRFFDRWMIGDD